MLAASMAVQRSQNVKVFMLKFFHVMGKVLTQTGELSCMVTGHVTPDTCFGVLCKQCRPSSDATKCSITSGSTLFSYRNFYRKCSKNDNIHQRPLKTGMGLYIVVVLLFTSTVNI